MRPPPATCPPPAPYFVPVEIYVVLKQKLGEQPSRYNMRLRGRNVCFSSRMDCLSGLYPPPAPRSPEPLLGRFKAYSPTRPYSCNDRLVSFLERSRTAVSRGALFFLLCRNRACTKATRTLERRPISTGTAPSRCTRARCLAWSTWST